MFHYLKNTIVLKRILAKSMYFIFIRIPYYSLWAIGVGFLCIPIVFVAICGWLLLNPSYQEIEESFHTAIEKGDFKGALKYVQAYQKREKKMGARSCKNSGLAPGEGTYAYLKLYAYLYEASGELDKASEYSNAYDVKTAETTLITLFAPLPYDRARILYKNGKKEDSFREYCASPPNLEFSQESLKRERHVLLYQGRGLEWARKLSCFETYDEFLAFLDDEYEKLGRPDEYADAVAAYHAIANVEGESNSNL